MCPSWTQKSLETPAENWTLRETKQRCNYWVSCNSQNSNFCCKHLHFNISSAKVTSASAVWPHLLLLKRLCSVFGMTRFWWNNRMTFQLLLWLTRSPKPAWRNHSCPKNGFYFHPREPKLLRRMFNYTSRSVEKAAALLFSHSTPLHRSTSLHPPRSSSDLAGHRGAQG